MANSGALLSLRDINKYFPGVHALKDAHFEVRRGEVHALIGENGADKSTMIKIISGVYQPDTGEIYLDGRRVAFATPREAHSAGIATIYQELGLYPELTVAENIFMGHAPMQKRFGIQSIDWERMEARAADLLAELNITNLDVREKVVVSKWLASEPKLLIMDEPTRGIDVGAKAEIHWLMSRHQRTLQLPLRPTRRHQRTLLLPPRPTRRPRPIRQHQLRCPRRKILAVRIIRYVLAQ